MVFASEIFKVVETVCFQQVDTAELLLSQMRINESNFP